MNKINTVALTIICAFAASNANASKLDKVKGVLKFSKETLSVAADLKEVFGGDDDTGNSATGGQKGSNSIVFSVAQAAELNGLRLVDSFAEINTLAMQDTTVFVMIGDQAAVIQGGTVEDSSLTLNKIDLSDNLIGYLGVEQKFSVNSLDMSQNSVLAANQVFIDGSNLGYADISQLVAAYNLSLDNSQLCLNCISVQ